MSVITLIPAAEIAAITGATTDEQIKSYDDMAVSIIENFLQKKLLKTDIIGELITMPYGLSRIITAKWKNINSVSALQVLHSDGSYSELPNAVNKTSISDNLIELLFNFHDDNTHKSQWQDLFRPSVIPAKVASIKLDYNAGYYNDFSDESIPQLLRFLAGKVLDYFINAGGASGFKSESMGSYSYTKEDLQRGLPTIIAVQLEALSL
jgi:hypothetical protein